MDEKQYTDLAVHIQEIDSRCKSNEHRIDDLEDEIKKTNDMQITLVKLANGVENMGNQLIGVKEDSKLFSGIKGADKLGVGSNMVKSIIFYPLNNS